LGQSLAQKSTLDSVYTSINMSSERQSKIDWNDVVKKEARGSHDEDLGEVQEIGTNYIFVEKGLISKEKFYIPFTEVDSFDGNVLRFKLSEEEIRSNYTGDPLASSPNVNIVKGDTKNEDKRSEAESASPTLPLVEEKLNVSKTEVIYKEAKIIKEPLTKIEEVEVPLTHEELVFERRPAGKNAPSIRNMESPVTSRQEIKIPLKREELELKKETYVKEEVIIKKKRIVETKMITEELKGDKLLDSGRDMLEGR
jgi:uncharacterized protein (TIGR02271 family)